MSEVNPAEAFLFDTQGFILVEGVLSRPECAQFIEVTDRLAERQYDDAWLRHPLVAGQGSPTLEVTNGGVRTRLNGLLRLDPIFHQLIAQPTVVKYLRAFMKHPQLINTWSIRKTRGEGWGGWHRGVPQTSYTYHNGVINSRMVNVITFLADTSVDDGCLAVLPGSHKANIDLEVEKDYPGDKAPGHLLVPAHAGDVMIFSEALVHNGSPKVSTTARTNLYYNYVEATDTSAMMAVVGGHVGDFHHYWVPPSIRDQFDAAQTELTEWMQWLKWEHIDEA